MTLTPGSNLRLVTRDGARAPRREAAQRKGDNVNPLAGIFGFSAVETVAVILWAKIAGIAATADLGTQVVAAIALFAFYVVEHIMAFNVGKGRPLFDRIRP